MYDEAAKERQKLSEGRGKKGLANCPDLKGTARDQVGETFGVSGKSVDRAAKVIKDGIPEIAEAVDSNEITTPRKTTRRQWTAGGFFGFLAGCHDTCSGRFWPFSTRFTLPGENAK